jgi:ankyrin repeat protein
MIWATTEILSSIISTLAGSSPQNATQLAALNAQNRAGNTALHWAALNGHLECVKALLDAGADPTITNAAGHDAVYEAELNEKKEVVEWVLKESEGLETGIGKEGGLEEGVEDNAQEEGDGSKMTDGEDGVRQDEALRAEMGDLSMADGKEGS